MIAGLWILALSAWLWAAGVCVFSLDVLTRRQAGMRVSAKLWAWFATSWICLGLTVIQLLRMAYFWHTGELPTC